MLGKPAPTPAYTCAPDGASFWRRALTPLRDAQSWLDVLWCLVGLVTAAVAFSLALAWTAAAASGLTYWFWQRWLPAPRSQDFVLAEELGLGDTRTAESLLYLGFGVVALLTLPLVVRFAAALHGSLAHALLSSRAELQDEVRRVQGGRDAARAAEAASLRRLERDIHDGPQQRLVRLQMDLARAQRQMERDPDAARTTLGDAAGLARETLEELRALSRGIAPPVLADRGLAAALAAVSARSPVPVELDVEGLPAERLAPVTENTAYFVVSEALANAAKHSDATTVRVSVARFGGLLRVEVEDDGSGGAVLAPGHGLAGLSDRLRAVDGALTVDSPRGGPTRLIAEIPCA
jgi:signal transduction histidine kinase